MARNLDEFANDLTAVTQQVVQAAAQGARTTAQARALYQDAVRAAAARMSTADLQRVKKQLER